MDRRVEEILERYLGALDAGEELDLGALCDGDDALLAEVRRFLTLDASIGAALESRGVTPDRIHIESFGPGSG